MKLVVICSRITQPVTSTGQLMYIRFSAARNSGFSLLYHQMLQSEGLTDSSNSNSDRDFKLTGLVGGVLGVTLLFVTLALIFIFCYKRLSRKQKQTSKTSGNNGGDSRQSINPTALPTSDDEDTGLTSGPSTSDPPTSTPATFAPPTSAPSTSDPPSSDPPISDPPTSAPPISAPPTSAPYTSAPPTSVPPTSAPPTSVPTISASQTFCPAYLYLAHKERKADYEDPRQEETCFKPHPPQPYCSSRQR
ncbi:proline-rich receptor-like protein kinase PERK10 [Pomacea canaliculata]|uniref:proline-rich receptor-like protein kinase PERK10 n=1 Tax=Pomacea canaliculata TaxID=400727 RepID=UPI000D730CD0|nr:proline-rich receptor-like protein kinase PERK10 [Pomacea canaliculata]